MNKLTLAQLAAYGRVKVEGINGDVGYADLYDPEDGEVLLTEEGRTDGYWRYIDNVKPHLRSMQNLDKPVVVEGYNESKEFVPIAELYYILAKTPLLKRAVVYTANNKKMIWAFTGQCDPLLMVSLSKLNFSYDRGELPADIVVEYIDLLNLWQFDYRGWIEQGLAVELKD